MRAAGNALLALSLLVLGATAPAQAEKVFSVWDYGAEGDGKAGGGQEPKVPAVQLPKWRAILARRVREFGHRNWIVIADAAYPAQARAGIETVLTNADHLQVVKAVQEELARAKHVRPVVFLDAELSHVAEKDAPGVGEYRQALKALLAGQEPQLLLHERIIDRLDKAGEKFKVLILKTNLTLPYTSVFLELDCRYWSPEAERRLRKALRPEKE